MKDRTPKTQSNIVAFVGPSTGSIRALSSRRSVPSTERPVPSTQRALEKLAYYGLEVVGHVQGRVRKAHVQVHRNIPYLGTGRRSHLLDVYVPQGRTGPLPVVMYVHGGAFMWCSKDTHFLFAHAWAEAGFVVFNINYRLAPRNMFPAAVQDACEALRWVGDNAARFGGDPRRLVLSGESAGANLVTALTIACCSARSEPWARALFDAQIVPRAVVAACGILQVSDARRFSARRALPGVVRRILHLLPDGYVDLSAPRREHELDFADPLRVFESGYRFERPLPGFFLPVGTADPLLDDTRRMAGALSARGVPCDVRYYAGEIHAFHAMVWRALAQQCWRDSFRFVDAQLRTPRLVRVAG
jgi:acetyl esterase